MNLFRQRGLRKYATKKQKKNTRKIPVKVEVEGKPTNQKEVKFPTLMRFAFVSLIHREIDVWFYLLQIKTVS